MPRTKFALNWNSCERELLSLISLSDKTNHYVLKINVFDLQYISITREQWISYKYDGLKCFSLWITQVRYYHALIE